MENPQQHSKDILSKEEKSLIERWIIENVTSSVVPNDEGNGDALCYNLVQLLRHGGQAKFYDYSEEQEQELRDWGRGVD